MNNIHIEYFAILREQAGKDRESLRTAAETPEQLFSELSVLYKFPQLQSIKVAINDEFSEMSALLHDGDSVVFIPPVAGG